MTIPASFFCAIFSSLALVLGIPNEFFAFGSALFGLTALIPLYLALKDSRNFLHAGLLGGLTIALMHLLSSYWLANFRDFALFTLGATTIAYFCAGFLVGTFLRYALSFPSPVRPFLFAAVWTVWEWSKSIGFLAYPWGTLAMTSRELTLLIQIADLTGTWGIGFLFSLVSAAAAEVILARYHPAQRKSLTPTIVFTCLLVAAATAYGAVRLAYPAKSEKSLDIVMVQQNVNAWDTDGVKKAILASEALTRKAIAEAGGKKPDLVTWSESTLPEVYAENRDYYAQYPNKDPFGPFLAETGVPLLVGSPVRVDKDRDDYANSVILIAPTGEQLGFYNKIQLIAFAEYLPFTEYAAVRKFYDSLVGFSSGWVPGTELKTLVVKNKSGDEIRFAAPICFEDAFSGLIARLHNTGSDLVINLSNDFWALVQSAEYQHFVIASFRAIELRTTLVRSTNAGYSVVVNPEGKVIADQRLFTASAAFVTVPVYPRVMTFYARFQDWFPSLLFIILLCCILRTAVTGKPGMIDKQKAVR